jgi:predicted N-acyltransferase
LADDATDEEVEALMKAVKKKLSFTHSLIHSFIHSPIYIETRNFNDYSRWKNVFSAAGFDYQPHLNFHVDCTDKEAMWENLSENRKRQVRHVNGDFKFKISNLRFDNLPVTEQDVRGWYEILAELYRTKVKTPLWPVEFFLEAYRQKVGRFMLVQHEGKIIGGSMVVTDGKAVYEWFECGLNAKYKEQYPSVMATWAGMQLAHENGCARYDMMGAGVPGVPYGVRDFKSEFGGDMVEHGRFLCVCKPLLYKLGVLGVKILKRK